MGSLQKFFLEKLTAFDLGIYLGCQLHIQIYIAADAIVKENG
jgi:hypothetical protein